MLAHRELANTELIQPEKFREEGINKNMKNLEVNGQNNFKILKFLSDKYAKM